MAIDMTNITPATVIIGNCIRRWKVVAMSRISDVAGLGKPELSGSSASFCCRVGKSVWMLDAEPQILFVDDSTQIPTR